jgi:hypothetical protein
MHTPGADRQASYAMKVGRLKFWTVSFRDLKTYCSLSNHTTLKFLLQKTTESAPLRLKKYYYMTEKKVYVILRRNMKIKLRKKLKTAGATFLEAKERVIRVILVNDAKA